MYPSLMLFNRSAFKMWVDIILSDKYHSKTNLCRKTSNLGNAYINNSYSHFGSYGKFGKVENDGCK